MKSSGALLTCIVLLILLASASEATISCSDVVKDLKPCISYLTGSGTGQQQPPATCCNGAKALAAAASSSADKKAACECIKSTSKNLNINSKLAQALAGSCGISLPIAISPNADCSKVG